MKLCDAFAAVLKADRLQFNTLFEQARRNYPALDRAAFIEFLTQCADPVIRAVDALKPECVADTARVAYEVGLELVGKQLAGPQARTNGVNHMWQRVLCAAASVVAVEPLRLASALSNAAHKLGIAVGVRCEAWITRMAALAPRAADAETLLRLGQVVAWQCGMAHYRSSALDAADQLPEALAREAVGADTGASWATVREQLRLDPWYDPRNRSTGEGVAARAGSFRGFGGLFPQPPQVMAQGDQLYVRSGDSCWRLMADTFGATFHNIADAAIAKTFSPLKKLPTGLSLPMTLGAPTSVAVTGTTVAVTGGYTHAVLLFARQSVRP